MRRFPMFSVREIRPTSDRDDNFHQVPKSDRDAGYSDRGQLGGYAPSNEPYPPPSDVKFETGYGVDEADVKRGYELPSMREVPAYDLANYKDRATLPKIGDPESDPQDTDEDEYAFRARGMRSRGFLTRQR